ncbi:3'(2'),5'-bisphosphate nucleotidase CysQ [Candidatus Woesearchaeota archaeon]|nr:3'(2'),5'-bisphosphate nucleotidase CysQ [Candidatus Woesearchaeota archaeon]
MKFDIAMDAIQEAGEAIMEIYDKDFSVSTKDDKSPITEADNASNEILIKALNKTGYGILSEETGHQGSKDTFWVIDPLDGTYDFIQKTDEFSIMVALVNKGKPIFGIVYAPSLEKLYYAVEGKGTFLNNEKIKVSEISNPADMKMVISRNHFRERDQNIAKNIGITNFIKMGSVGVKYGAIAEGKAEVCIYTTNKLGLWDCCAPQIILKEAGGLVFDKQGNEPQYSIEEHKMMNGFIGCNSNKKMILGAINE